MWLPVRGHPKVTHRGEEGEVLELYSGLKCFSKNQIVARFGIEPLEQPGTSPHKAKSLTTTGDACRYGVLLISLSLSLSHLGFFVFSFSQAQPWPSFCFHSHLSPLVVPLIGVTTTEVKEADIGE
ncbi:hypothetical protein CMV_023329 [Castanea mollissima]|uniref:Uncharacterized protein n=1 Tax=Castanea mollissima TaxID=60419 RepID=A0A8J4QK90_9ROSI|nr:hypothetical protein CMV_023329 [Castanea mollissima]